MGQVTSAGQVQAHDAVVGVEQSGVNRKVGRAAGICMGTMLVVCVCVCVCVCVW